MSSICHKKSLNDVTLTFTVTIRPSIQVIAYVGAHVQLWGFHGGKKSMSNIMCPKLLGWIRTCNIMAVLVEQSTFCVFLLHFSFDRPHNPNFHWYVFRLAGFIHCVFVEISAFEFYNKVQYSVSKWGLPNPIPLQSIKKKMLRICQKNK